MKKYLSIDIGGTFVKIGVYDKNAKEYYSDKFPTERNPDEFLKILLNTIEEIQMMIEEDINGVAISMAGFINPTTGENMDFSVGELFKKYNFKKEIKNKLGYDVVIENDAKCVALAEKWLGNGKECSDFIVVTFGTGIGGAIIINDNIYRGKNFKAGEFGISILGKSERNYVNPIATASVVKKISKALGKNINGQYIFNNLDNIIIKEVYDQWIEESSILIGNLMSFFDPEKILIGGGISEEDKFIDSLKNKVEELFPQMIKYTRIERCKFKNDAGKLGALYNLLINNDEKI